MKDCLTLLTKKKMKLKLSQFNITIEKSNKDVTLYNCYSGRLIRLDTETYEQLSIGCFDTPLLDKLKDSGFIVEKAVDEYKEVRQKHIDFCQRNNPTVVSLVIAPTMNCNMKCVYCFERGLSQQSKNKQMSQQTLIEIISYLEGIINTDSKLETINITWFGGEPLLCFDSIAEFSERVQQVIKPKNIQLRTKIITNGALLDESKMKCLRERCNLHSLQITLDGLHDTYCSKKQTSSEVYERVIENLCRATKYARVTVRLNADKTNVHELTQVAKQLLNNQINENNLYIHFAQLRDYESTEPVASSCFEDSEYRIAKGEFYNKLVAMGYRQKIPIGGKPHFSPKPYCGIYPKHNFAIDPEGYLYKCEHQLGDTSKSIGHISQVTSHEYEYKCFIEDSRCKVCNIFPCCHYSQCAAMHKLTGLGECTRYSDVYKVIIQSVKNHISKEEEN